MVIEKVFGLSATAVPLSERFRMLGPVRVRPALRARRGRGSSKILNSQLIESMALRAEVQSMIAARQRALRPRIGVFRGRGGGGGGEGLRRWGSESSVYTPAPVRRSNSVSSVRSVRGPGYFSNNTRAGSFGNLNRAGSFGTLNRAGSYGNLNRVGSFTNLNRTGSFRNINRAGSFGNISYAATYGSGGVRRGGGGQRRPNARGLRGRSFPRGDGRWRLTGVGRADGMRGQGGMRGRGRGQAAGVRGPGGRGRGQAAGVRGPGARGRGQSLGIRGPGARGRGLGSRGRGVARNPNQRQQQQPSKEDLDNQLDEYMASSKSALDRELDAYMKDAE